MADRHNPPRGWRGAQASGTPASPTEGKAAVRPARSGPYKHLMTGVSYMLPLVIAGGLAIALVNPPAR